MDIRNFFGKKTGGDGANKKKAPPPAAASAAADPVGSSRSKGRPSETSKKDKEEKDAVVEDMSEVPPSRKKTTYSSNQQKTTTTTKATPAARKASSPIKSSAKPSASSSPNNKRKEVSTSDYFASNGNSNSNGDNNSNSNSNKAESPRKKAKSSNRTLSSLATKKESNNGSEVDLTNDDDDNDNDNNDDNKYDVDMATRSSPRRTTRQSTPTSTSISNGSSTPTKSPTTRRAASSSSSSSAKKGAAEVDETADTASSPSPRKKVKPSPKASSVVQNASSVKKAPASKVKRDPPLPPTMSLPQFDTDTAVSESMEGYTFVFSGNMEGLTRDGASELVKILGARVTTAVSKKTDYLVVGDILEDGRPYTEGSKYKRAVQEGCIIVRGEEALYGLCQQYDNKARAARGLEPASVAAAAAANQSLPSASLDRKPAPDAKLPPAAAATAATKAVNPYARGPVSNPYAKAAANPYAKKAAPLAAPVASAGAVTSSSSKNNNNNMLWVDKYKPASSSEILGNQEAVNKLTIWLKMWESRFNNPQAVGKAFSNPNGPWKAALLSGPPGIGTLLLHCP